MHPLEAVAYVSSACGLPDEAHLEALLRDARAHNLNEGVTGALLFHDGTFFQYFEGPPEGVQRVYRRILRSPLHHGLIELMRGAVPERVFGRWSMGFARAPRSLVLQLSQTEWDRDRRRFLQAASLPAGADLLLDFWHSCIPGGRGAAAAL
jgi:hypothetical protein